MCSCGEVLFCSRNKKWDTVCWYCQLMGHDAFTTFREIGREYSSDKLLLMKSLKCEHVAILNYG